MAVFKVDFCPYTMHCRFENLAVHVMNCFPMNIAKHDLCRVKSKSHNLLCLGYRLIHSSGVKEVCTFLLKSHYCRDQVVSGGCTEEPGTRNTETRNFFGIFNKKHGDDGHRYTHSQTLKH